MGGPAEPQKLETSLGKTARLLSQNKTTITTVLPKSFIAHYITLHMRQILGGGVRKGDGHDDDGELAGMEPRAPSCQAHIPPLSYSPRL